MQNHNGNTLGAIYKIPAVPGKDLRRDFTTTWAPRRRPGDFFVFVHTKSQALLVLTEAGTK